MPKEYAALFPGGISLQPYQREEYATKMSAITLDSLSAGCPVVTVAGTSMAAFVGRFDAGMVVAGTEAGGAVARLRSVDRRLCAVPG